MTTVDTAQLGLKMLGPDISNEREYRPVRVLSDIIVNQIAAGEVVERPSSVVKELVENAIDAGSTNILVVVENGGQSSVEVIDNGCGMAKDDALLAIERFGTSKLQSVDDLLGIGTHGFRGEALPSIAAVSRLTLSTAREGGSGTEIRIDGGKLRDVASKQLPAGTRILVRQLFYNVPARKKFLRSERTETGAIKALIADFAAAYPRIRFRLVSDGQELMNLPACANFYDRAAILQFAGRDALEIETSLPGENGPYVLTGVLTKPRDCVIGASRLRLLVNGRSVRDRVLLKAVRDAYGNFLKGDRYPSGVLRLEVPPIDVDVNVHPQKTEIRFRTTDMIFRLVRSGISAAFRRANIVSEALTADVGGSDDIASLASHGTPHFARSDQSSGGGERAATFFNTIQNPFPLNASRFGSPLTDRADAIAVGLQSSVTPKEVQPSLLEARRREEPTPGSRDSPLSYRYLGQIFDCYLLFEEGERLVVVDMHAAHERVTHARLLRQFSEGGVQAQLLLMPEHIEIQAGEMDRFLQLVPVLERLGFEAERFSTQTVVIRSVPAILSTASPRSMILDLLSLEEHRDWHEKISHWVDNAVARLACHGSVRSGRKLEREEAYALLESIQSADLAAFCPHGRPVMLSLSESQIETMFGRA